MNNFDWEIFLKQESKKAITKYQEEKSKVPKNSWTDNRVLPPEVLESEWLGFPGASEEQIVAAENRLRVSLPPSYREFLKVTNGWRDYPGFLGLRPVEKIDWFCVENQDWIDAWVDAHEHLPPIPDEKYFVYEALSGQPLRTEYMQTTLQISDTVDNDVILLNPKIIHYYEWEVITFRDSEVTRLQSFKKMLQTFGMLNFRVWI